MEKVRIQDDLYTYVNQEWMDQAIIPEDRPTVGGFADLDKEGKVVLTREEKEEYESLIKLLIYDKPMKNRVYEVIKDIKQQTRKETAEKILNELLDFVNGWFEGAEDNDFIVEFNRISKDLAEKYGVDMK